MKDDDKTQTATTLSCPQCGQLLNLVSSANEACFVCSEAHRYSLQTLLASQGATSISLLQAALVFLEQQGGLLKELTEQVWRTQPLVALQLDGYHDQIEERIDKLKQLLQDHGDTSAEPRSPSIN